MLIDPHFEKCILCTERIPDSREHIIPACVGGTLQALILCTPCNSQFGASFVAQLKGDPSIRMAVWYLRDHIPQLAAQFEECQEFHAKGAGDIAVEASRKGDTWKTKARETNADGLIMDTEDVPRYVRNTMKKQGLSGSEAESWVNRLAACEDGEQFQLPTGDILIKNKATVQLPKLTEGFLDNRVPVLIAYEFLALCFGEKILGPDFNAIRECIRVGTKTEQVQVQNKRTRQYSPEHVVKFRVRHHSLTVFVQFFRCYVFEIAFCNIPMPPKEIMYVEDLKNRQRLLALSLEDAKQGNWTIL